MATRTFERESQVEAPIAAVWARVVSPEGINDEMRPWLTMRFPRGLTASGIEDMPVGQPIGRVWLRLFGVVPFDFDHRHRRLRRHFREN